MCTFCSHSSTILWILFLLSLFVDATDVQQHAVDINSDCIEKAGLKNCGVFNRCCDFYCQDQDQQHFCMSILGQIQEQHSYCACASGSNSTRQRCRSRHIDLVIVVISLIFVDYVLFDFIV